MNLTYRLMDVNINTKGEKQITRQVKSCNHCIPVDDNKR